MLKSIVAQQGRRQVVRMANIPSDDDFLAELDLDAQGNEELGRLVGRSRPSDNLEELCDAPFRLKRRLRRPTRFSDGSFPVFYSSLDGATAEAEVQHWLPRYIGEPEELRTVYYQRFVCTFDGSEKDLRPELGRWPDLVNDSDYSFCNQLGAEAVRKGIDGLVTPSARRHDGSNLPVFKRPAISNPKLEGAVAMTYHPVSGTVTVVSQPY